MREIVALKLGRIIRWPFAVVTKRRWMPDACAIGLTIIYWVEPWEALKLHEHEHVIQCQELGRWRFWFEYLNELRRNGYRNSRFEVAARRASGEEL